MSGENSSGSGDQSNLRSAFDEWCIKLGVSPDSFKQGEGGLLASIGPGNWGRGPGQDYRGPGGANEPGPNNPVKVPFDGDTDTGPDTEPQNRIKIDPDADPEAPTDPAPTLRSPEVKPQLPPETLPSKPPSVPPKTPPSNPNPAPTDGSPPTLRSPGVKPASPEVGPGALGTAGVVIGGDVVIAGAIVVAGVLEIVGAIYQIVMGWRTADLAQSYTPSVEAAKAGFKTGMTGGSAPSDPFGKLGYEPGSRNFEALFIKAKHDNPQATNEAIKAAISARADEALSKVAGAIDKAVRSGMWGGYLAAHPT